VSQEDTAHFYSHSKGHGLGLTKPETREIVARIRAIADEAEI
jgi:hypothetical protein